LGVLRSWPEGFPPPRPLPLPNSALVRTGRGHNLGLTRVRLEGDEVKGKILAPSVLSSSVAAAEALVALAPVDFDGGVDSTIFEGSLTSKGFSPLSAPSGAGVSLPFSGVSFAAVRSAFFSEGSFDFPFARPSLDGPVPSPYGSHSITQQCAGCGG
jgi:hypothetical protein